MAAVKFPILLCFLLRLKESRMDDQDAPDKIQTDYALGVTLSQLRPVK